jgi:hypothetical protein
MAADRGEETTRAGTEDEEPEGYPKELVEDEERQADSMCVLRCVCVGGNLPLSVRGDLHRALQTHLRGKVRRQETMP